MKSRSKWADIADRLANLKDGESIVLEPDGDPAEHACAIRDGLLNLVACACIRRSVKVENGKIVIRRMGSYGDASGISAAAAGVLYGRPGVHGRQ